MYKKLRRDPVGVFYIDRRTVIRHYSEKKMGMILHCFLH